MARPVTLFTGQWADLTLEVMLQKARDFGYDGVELACWGDHMDVREAASNDGYVREKKELLEQYGMQCFAISNHLAGQAVCDNIDARHEAILPPHVWGDGDPEGVRQRAAEEMIATAEAANAMGLTVVNGFTGSSIWHLLYSFPPVAPDQIDAGFSDFADRWNPILDVFQKNDVRFALEVHPTEIAFDIASSARGIRSTGEPTRVWLQLRPQPSGLSKCGLCRFYPRVQRPGLSRPHERRLPVAYPQTRGYIWRAYKFRRPRPQLGFPLRGSRQREF